ncbi:MAG: hypothetical protein GYB50_21260 [Rhodobacteraceae bacterium]|nr:hypothetical protein [Paracoccaceae bacterium]
MDTTRSASFAQALCPLDTAEIRALISSGASLHWLKPAEKRPVEANWTEVPRYDEDLLRAKYRDGFNIGFRPGTPSLLDGTRYLHVIDLDIRRPEYADEAWNRLLEMVPVARDLPSVISGSGGESRHIYFVCEEPFTTRNLAKSEGFDMVHDPAKGREVKKRHWEIDLAGTGKNVVLPPSIHPDTGQPYRWERPLELEFLALMGLPAEVFRREEHKSNATSVDWEVERPKVLDALEAITDAEDREEWVQIGMAIHSASGGSDDGFTVWCDWSEGSEKFDETDAARVWGSFKGEGATLGTLYHIAKEYGYVVPGRSIEITADDFEDLPKIPLPSRKEADWHLEAFTDDLEPDLSQDQLARDLGRAGWDRDARYVAELGRWHLWKQTHWESSKGMKPMAIVRNFINAKCSALAEWSERRAELLTEEEAEKLRQKTRAQIKTLRQEANLTAVERLARSNPKSLSSVEKWDAEDFLLGTPGGTVDLRTGELMAAHRVHYITMQTSVAPGDANAEPVAWLKFLSEVFPDDPDMPRFIQRLAGYALTGSTREHRFFLFHGTGRNGKGTLLNTLQEIMGDYAKGILTTTLLESRNPQHASPLARLRGARLVRGAELPVGHVWNESLVKQMTGGDVITANLMRQDAFEFVPKFTLIVDANTKPRIRTTDPAMQARMTLIPFRASFIGREDRGLPDKLKAEAPQILRWAIEGAVAWHREGLSIPAAVEAASRDYLESEDTIAHFIEEETIPDAGGKVSVGAVYEAYVRWAEIERVPAASKRAFGDMMEERGFERRKATGGKRVLVGLRLRSPFDDEAHGDV